MSDGVGDARPPEPEVPASTYDEAYYRECCGDFDNWTPDGSQPIGGIYLHAAELLGIGEGTTLVDVGCGRGELVCLASQRGATAIGIEYSEDALKLARQTLEGYGEQAELLLADARRIPIDDGVADCATLLDVVEHLTPQELSVALAEIHRILRPGGRVFSHTRPNRLIYSVTYRLLRWSWPPRGRSWPADPRIDVEREMHVNEMTLGELRRALRGGGYTDVEVTRGDWVHTGHLPGGAGAGVYHRLARTPGLRGLGSANLFAIATRP